MIQQECGLGETHSTLAVNCSVNQLNNLDKGLEKIQSTMQKQNKSWDRLVSERVDQSLQAVLPTGSSWILETPHYLTRNDEPVENIDVQFPNGTTSSSGRVIAQVWVQTGGERSMFAVPVQIQSLGDSSVTIASNVDTLNERS
jgi:hypothetical protein